MIDEPFEVPAETIARYQAEGFVRMPAGLDPDTVQSYGDEITRLTLALDTQDKPLEERDSYDRAFLQVMNLWRESGIVRAFVFGRRFAGIAAQLLGVKSVRRYHDQSLYKEPSGGITPAHADQYYWPLASDLTITVWIPLQPVPLEMGPLEFYKGSHLTELGRDFPISDESEDRICAEMEAHVFPIYRAPCALGDVSFHACRTIHRAGPNLSSRPRSVMTMIYMDAEIAVASPVNAMQEGDLARWLPGLKPGDRATSILNPVLINAA